MINPGKSLPREVIEHWPEIFEGIKLNVVPIRYLNAIIVTFRDGKIWEIKMDEQEKTLDWDRLEKNIMEMVKTYEENIEDVDFRLDTSKLKKDVVSASNSFFKKKKL